MLSVGGRPSGVASTSLWIQWCLRQRSEHLDIFNSFPRLNIWITFLCGPHFHCCFTTWLMTHIQNDFLWLDLDFNSVSLWIIANLSKFQSEVQKNPSIVIAVFFFSLCQLAVPNNSSIINAVDFFPICVKLPFRKMQALLRLRFFFPVHVIQHAVAIEDNWHCYTSISLSPHLTMWNSEMSISLTFQRCSRKRDHSFTECCGPDAYWEIKERRQRWGVGGEKHFLFLLSQ